MAKVKDWDTSPTMSLRVEEGFNLATFDRSSTPGFSGDKADGEELMARRGLLLSELQERYFANGKNGDERRILVVVQGLDTAGKGGIARHVLGMVDPQGVQLAYFGVPTKEELDHHFLWRIKKQLPRAGRIGLFDRSHYEDVLVQRVEKIVEQDVWEKRYDEINNWEKSLVEKEGFTLIKVALMVSHREQGLRLAERLARPDKWWKYSPNDVDTRLKWDDYQEAYQAVFDRTNTPWAPWHVIPADNKWFSRLAVTELITQALVDFDQDWPVPRWHLDVQKRRLVETMAPDDVEAASKVLDEKRDEVIAEIDEFEHAVATLDEQGDADSGHRLNTHSAPSDEQANAISDEAEKQAMAKAKRKSKGEKKSRDEKKSKGEKKAKDKKKSKKKKK